MARPVEDPVRKILTHFQENKVSKVVLFGEAGARKTWVARKACDSEMVGGSSYGSIWIVPAENPEKKNKKHSSTLLPVSCRCHPLLRSGMRTRNW